MAIDKNTDNLRDNIRHPVEVTMRLIDENGLEQKAVSGNVSDSGLYLTITIDKRPALQTVIEIQVLSEMGDGEAAPINRALVVRHDKHGVGLKFLFD